MGSFCSASKENVKDDLRHKRTINNKNNPTESYANWKEKFAVEATKSNPPQVVRDFPRMLVYVRLPDGTTNQSAMDKLQKTTKKSGKAGVSSPKKAANDPMKNPLTNSKPSQESVEEFQLRNAYVKETVVLLTKLCEEYDTFGKVFEAAWDRREREYTADGAMESKVMDVHQLFQLCCIESEMLVAPHTLSGAPSAGNTYLFDEENNTNNNNNNNNSKLNRASRQHSLNVTDLPGVLSVNNTVNSTGLGASQRRYANPMSANTSLAVHDTTQARLQACGGTVRDYSVQSVAFHLMTYAVQSVIYVPQQRLRHVLWMPWTTGQYEDIAWRVYFFSESLSAEEYRQCKRKAEQNMNFKASNHATMYPASSQVSRNNSCVDGESLDNSLLAPVQLNQGGGPAVASGEQRTAEGKSGSQKVFVVKHTLEARHHVDTAVEKNVPIYDLEWSCVVKLDKQFLSDKYHRRPSSGHPGSNNNVSNNSLNKAPTPAGGHFRTASNHNNGFPSSPENHIGNLDSNTNYNLPASQTKRRIEELDSEIMSVALTVDGCQLLKKKKQSYTNKWKESKKELAFLLEEQYKVPLNEVSQLKAKN
ncbi:hypothetical protein AGDE_12604 [Angomonas deanei]|uniref:Uncharacterized protein n=1 Tax=Angomonas deanei TaxID=59799 RepID=A0A7G2C5J6_9TRYP|nr:hypothetical protein AGDE_12604 [Angomonas deanei]CAD2215078.1 hypothetical protein, conserved [Angomonas deanei]|eukprot:EPY23959.1 hypothetical protein AGDE_12604 [Angomonas deanei]